MTYHSESAPSSVELWLTPAIVVPENHFEVPVSAQELYESASSYEDFDRFYPPALRAEIHSAVIGLVGQLGRTSGQTLISGFDMADAAEADAVKMRSAGSFSDVDTIPFDHDGNTHNIAARHKVVAMAELLSFQRSLQSQIDEGILSEEQARLQFIAMRESAAGQQSTEPLAIDKTPVFFFTPTDGLLAEGEDNPLAYAGLHVGFSALGLYDLEQLQRDGIRIEEKHDGQVMVVAEAAALERYRFALMYLNIRADS